MTRMPGLETAGGIPALLVSPAEDPALTVLYLRGGGYVLGLASGYQPHAGALAAAAQTGVLVPRAAPDTAADVRESRST